VSLREPFDRMPWNREHEPGTRNREPGTPGCLIVFDLDGTLVDSRRDLADSANELIRELGGHSLTEDAVGKMVGEGAAVLVRRALQAAGLGDVPGALPRFLELYDARLLTHTRPYDGIVGALEHARRHARIAVLTNKPTRATERILESLHLRPLIDDVIGGDGSHPRKPDPAALFALMTRAGASPLTTLLVGDSCVDLETAQAARVAVCLARYGFGFESVGPHQLRGDELFVDSPSEIVTVVTRFIS
jgi:phosphoglycolate phosphatase